MVYLGLTKYREMKNKRSFGVSRLRMTGKREKILRRIAAQDDDAGRMAAALSSRAEMETFCILSFRAEMETFSALSF